MDIMKYFSISTNDKLDGRALNTSIPGSSSSSVLSAARELNSLQEQQEQKKKRQVLPEKIKKEVAYHAWKHGNPEARRWASKKYPNFTFKRETLRDWKIKYQKNFESNEGAEYFTLRRQGRPAKYQDWYAEKVLQKLNRGVVAHDVKVDVRLSTIKPLHTRWIIDMYKHLKDSKGLVLSGLRKAHISEAVAEAANLAHLCKNPFQDIDVVVDTTS